MRLSALINSTPCYLNRGLSFTVALFSNTCFEFSDVERYSIAATMQRSSDIVSSYLRAD